MPKLPHIATYECRRGWRRLDVAFYSDGAHFIIKHREVRNDVNLKAHATDADMGRWKTHAGYGIFAQIDDLPTVYAATIMTSPKYTKLWTTIEKVA